MDDVEFRARIADPKFAEADREILKGRNNGRGDIWPKASGFRKYRANRLYLPV